MSANPKPFQHIPSVSNAQEHARSVPAWLDLIRDAVEGSDYGTILIKVHGGEVVQIEATRKIRVPSNSADKFSLYPTAPAEDFQQPIE